MRSDIASMPHCFHPHHHTKYNGRLNRTHSDALGRTRTHSHALARTHARTRTHHAQGDWEQDVIQDADVEVRCSDINHVCGILGESIRFQVCVKAWPVATPRIHFGFSLLEDTDGGHRPPLKWGRRKYCHQGSLSSR